MLPLLTDERLHRCLVYIDLNMVRAGLVDHPAKWEDSGYHEIQQPPKRYAVIDLAGLVALCGFSKLADFQTRLLPIDRGSSSRRLGCAKK